LDTNASSSDTKCSQALLLLQAADFYLSVTKRWTLQQGQIQGSIGTSAPAEACESNYIQHDFLQSGKQHSRYKAILSSIILSQQLCKVYFVPLTVAKPYETLLSNIIEIAPSLSYWLDPPLHCGFGHQIYELSIFSEYENVKANFKDSVTNTFSHQCSANAKKIKFVCSQFSYGLHWLSSYANYMVSKPGFNHNKIMCATVVKFQKRHQHFIQVCDQFTQCPNNACFASALLSGHKFCYS